VKADLEQAKAELERVWISRFLEALQMHFQSVLLNQSKNGSIRPTTLKRSKILGLQSKLHLFNFNFTVAPKLLGHRSAYRESRFSRRVTILRCGLGQKASQLLLCNLQTGTNLDKISSHQNLKKKVKNVNFCKLHVLVFSLSHPCIHV